MNYVDEKCITILTLSLCVGAWHQEVITTGFLLVMFLVWVWLPRDLDWGIPHE